MPKITVLMRGDICSGIGWMETGCRFGNTENTELREGGGRVVDLKDRGILSWRRGNLQQPPTTGGFTRR